MLPITHFCRLKVFKGLNDVFFNRMYLQLVESDNKYPSHFQEKFRGLEFFDFVEPIEYHRWILLGCHKRPSYFPIVELAFHDYFRSTL